VSTRPYAADSFDEIRANAARIAREAEQMCPTKPMTLFACLRSIARCPMSCPYYADWIGPQED